MCSYLKYALQMLLELSCLQSTELEIGFAVAEEYGTLSMLQSRSICSLHV